MRRTLAPPLVIAALLASVVACGKEGDDTATASGSSSQTTTSAVDTGADLTDLESVRSALRATCASTSGELEETGDFTTGSSTQVSSFISSSLFAAGSTSDRFSTTQLLDRTGKPLSEPITQSYEFVTSGNLGYLRDDPASGGDGVWYSARVDASTDVDDCAFNASEATPLFSEPELIVGVTSAVGPEGDSNAFVLEIDPNADQNLRWSTVTLWLADSVVDRIRVQTPGQYQSRTDTTLTFKNLGGDVQVEIPSEATEISIDEFEAKFRPTVDDPATPGR